MLTNPRTDFIDNPSRNLLLSIARISFFLVLGSMYFFFNGDTIGWIKAFVIGSVSILVMNHILYYFVRRTSQILILAAVDIAVTIPYGYIYLGGDYPDLLFLGLIGLFLFLYVELRAVTIVWSVIMIVNIMLQILIEQHVFGKVEIVMYFVTGSFVVFASLIGSLIRYYQKARMQTASLYRELEESNKQLSAYANEMEKLAVSRERIRISREIHDTVGHKMTALLMQLQVARKLQERNSDESMKSFMNCEELARSALREVRLSVGALREESSRLTVKESLDKLASEFAEMTGMQISVLLDGKVTHIPDSLQVTMFRIVQESLTNAQKHGQASQAWVSVEYSERQISLKVRDNGTGQESITLGFGLLNMQERVNEHGGTMRIDSQEVDGFEINITLPLKHTA